MLEIVAKRAALRPSDPAGASSSHFEVSYDDNEMHAVLTTPSVTNSPVEFHTFTNISTLVVLVAILFYFYYFSTNF